MLTCIRMAFVAIDLPPDVQECLTQISAQLREQVGERSVRWVPIPNIHLTLKFLGDVSVNNLDVLKEIISAEAAQQKPMEFSVGRLGAFPKAAHPRIVWVGVEAPQELTALQRGIEALELPVELERAFSRDKRARAGYEAYTKSYKKAVIYWITSAKREETRRRRVHDLRDVLQRQQRTVVRQQVLVSGRVRIGHGLYSVVRF